MAPTHAPHARSQDDEEAVKAAGVRIGARMCRELLDSGATRGLHFYTLNLDKVTTAIIDLLKVKS